MTLWLGEDDIEALLDPVLLVDRVEGAFLRLHAIEEPPSVRIDGTDGATGYLTVFPAADRGSGMASAKLLAGRPANAAEGLPEIDAVVALVEADRGRIVALLSARLLTGYRTAAVTAAALRRLVPENAVVGLVGTGLQARAHLRILAATGLADRVFIASPSRGEAAAEALIANLPDDLARRCAPSSLGAIASRCDVLVTLSLARKPLALGPLPRDFVLVGVGPFYPSAHEIDPTLIMSAAMVVSDDPDRLRSQWQGELVATRDIAGFPALFRGDVPALRNGLRVVLSDGRGFEDNIAATLIFEAARRAGRGLPLP